MGGWDSFLSTHAIWQCACQMKLFIDQQGGLWAQGKLNNKVVSAMATAQNNNGGQEMTIRSLYQFMSLGAIIVPELYGQ